MHRKVQLLQNTHKTFFRMHNNKKALGVLKLILVSIITVLIFVVVLLYCCIRAGAKAEQRQQKLFNQHKENHKS